MRLFFIVCLILITVISFDTPPVVRAGNITVNVTCTLVDAIIAANTDAPSGGCPAGSGADVITLDVNVLVATPYQDDLGLPVITSDITIQSGIGDMISGNNTNMHLFVVNTPNSRLALVGLTIQDFRDLSEEIEEGITTPAGGSVIVISNSSAEVYVVNSIIKNNSSVGIMHTFGFGEDVYGGAIYNEGYLEIYNSLLQNNTATAINGVINPKWAAGGAIYNVGTLVIQSSTFDSNHTEASHPDLAMAPGGAIFLESPDAIIRNSTFSNNSVTTSGDSVEFPVGGAIAGAGGGPTIIENTLFSGNTALESESNQGRGGALWISNASGTLSVTNSTFYQNSADIGGAIVTEQNVSTISAVITFNTLLDNTSVLGADAVFVWDTENVVFTGNVITSSNPLEDCAGLTTANGSNNLNLAGDTSCDVISSGNIIPGTHFSTTLTDEGLSVPQFLPLLNVSGNPAVNAVPGCGLTEDQRGLPRDANCDVGSYELQEPPVPTDTPVPPTDTPIPPTDTPMSPTDTPIPPTDTSVPPTDTTVPSTDTPIPPTDTPVPPTDTPVPPTDTPVPPTDTPGSVNLLASATCVDENLAVTISAGDGPFNITASAGVNTPVNGVGVGTTTINGPEKWDNLTVTETGGNGESINLGQFKCRTDERPVPVSPAHRSHTTNLFPTFSWTGITSANNYRIFVFDDPVVANRTVDIRQNSGGPTMMVLSTPLPDGRLFWRVRGRQNRIWSLSSVRFTLFKDPAAPLSALTPVPTIDLNAAPTLSPQPTVAPTFPAPPNSR
ncbi:MAG: hypothetical protein L0154_19340 [Chloroflexi bacterium]|nr:hypothetical protein [Chloroflexota bacterium]